MSSRNEQFVLFVGLLVTALPAAVWMRDVGPRRTALAADQARYQALETTLEEFKAQELVVLPETAQEEWDTIRKTQDGLTEIMQPVKSVSEMYREIEFSSSTASLVIDRIDPGRDLIWSTLKSPTEKFEYRVGKRSYRLELHGSSEGLPIFLATLEDHIGFGRIHDVRVQRLSDSLMNRKSSFTVLVDTLEVDLVAQDTGG